MFLRAAELKQEQEYIRRLAALSNQAGGAGIVHGFDCTVQGGQLHVGPGLAIDPQGRVLRLPQSTTVGIDELIAQSQETAGGDPASAVGTSAAFKRCELRAEDGPAPLPSPTDLYVITLGHAEAACGESEVYGDPCRQACDSNTDYAYLVEGVIIRAQPFRIPLQLESFPNLTQVHLRSRIASGFFAWEQQQTADLISREGLASVAWCLGAAEPGGDNVPLALLCVGPAPFLDCWIVRRERMDPPPRRYWMHRMAMRPWSVFQAQVLQFQCQLRHCFHDAADDDTGPDPCRSAHDAMSDAAKLMEEVLPHYAAVSEFLAANRDRFPELDVPAFASGVSRLQEIKSRFETAPRPAPAMGLLLNCGLVEVPSAGYLPVFPGREISVNEQVRQMMGEGVDLRFCAVRPDFVPHALEEAQHMERISLMRGLENPKAKPRVDVLVPDGEVQPARTAPAGAGYEMTLELLSPGFRLLAEITNPTADGNGEGLLDDLLRPGGPRFQFRGAARGERSPRGGAAFYYAGAFQPPERVGPPAFTLIELLRHAAVWTSMETDRDPFELPLRDSLRVVGEVLLFLVNSVFRVKLFGNLQILGSQSSAAETRLSCRLTGSLEASVFGGAASQPAPRSISISEPVVLLRRGEVRPTVEVVLPSPSPLGAVRKLLAFRVVRQWPHPDEAAVQAVLQPPQTLQPAGPSFTVPPLIPLFNANQKLNPDVLSPSHSAHTLSVTALRVLGAVVREADFEELAVRKLFPPPRAVSQELVIHARESWVLFHRRREKQCTQEAPAPNAVGPRRYRLYLVALNTIAQRDDLHRALLANDGPVILGFQPQLVTVAEFAAGIQSLASSPDIVRSEWQRFVGNEAGITYGAVASTGAALDEGAALAAARLGALTSVLDGVTPVQENVHLESLPAVPDASAISAVPHDGVMVVATLPLPLTCHEIFRLDSTANVDGFIAAVPDTPAKSVVDVLLPQANAKHVGAARFRHDGADLVSAAPSDLATAWNDQGNGLLVRALVISQRRDPPDDQETIDRYIAQSKRIAAEIGGSVNDVLHLNPRDMDSFGECSALTVLVARPRTRTVCNELFVTKIGENDSIDEFLRKIQVMGVALVTRVSPNDSLGAVNYELPGNKPDETSLEKVKERWSRRFPPRTQQPEFFIGVSPKGVAAPDQEMHKAQSEVIRNALNGRPDLRTVVSGDRAPFPSKCPAITLAVLRIIG
jgi:hypothetical protein